METEKLYYQDVFLRAFDAAVVSCQPEKKRWLVALDRTAFYPEGGGQGADHGTLGGAKVLDVHEKDGVILHTCDAPLTVGDTVHGEIDWGRRFDHMQQHSGEHIVSGMLCAAYHCDNVGFHLGADVVTIDYNADIPWEGVLEIERRANEYIWADHPLEILWPTAEELDALDYRSKKALSGAVRITSFPGADTCACCGTHVARSGQVGLVKFLSCQRFREGVRLELLCGKRALDYLAVNWEQNHRIAQALSVKPQASLAAVERLQRELQEVKLRAAALEETAFAATAEEYRGAGDVLLFRPDMANDSVRRLCDTVSAVCGGRCAVFAGQDGSYKYAVIHAGQDIRAFIREMNAALSGRGGGRDGFAQGSVRTGEAEIRAFFQKAGQGE
jgi:alanyl-tRNA synthetase